jgi:hypothetical protein
MAKQKRNYRKKTDTSEEEDEDTAVIDIKRKKIVTESLVQVDSSFKEKKLHNKVDFRTIVSESRSYDSKSIEKLKREQIYTRKAPKVSEQEVLGREPLIPDQEAIERAKKERHKKRLLEGKPEEEFIPLTVATTTETESRLIRDDQVDEEDFDDYKGQSIAFGENAVKLARERERLEKIELLTVRDDDVPDDEEVQKWELQRIHDGQRSNLEVALQREHVLTAGPIIDELPIPDMPELPTIEEVISGLSINVENLTFTIEQHKHRLSSLDYEMDESHKALDRLESAVKRHSKKHDYFQDLNTYIQDLVEFFDVKDVVLRQLEDAYLGRLIHTFQANWKEKFDQLDLCASYFHAPFQPDPISVSEEVYSQESLQEISHKLFEDASKHFRKISIVKEKFETWKVEYHKEYEQAYGEVSIPEVFDMYVRFELLEWDPLNSSFEFEDMQWHEELATFGTHGDTKLVSKLIESSVIPRFQVIFTNTYDIGSENQTKYALRTLTRFLDYMSIKSNAFQSILDFIEDRIKLIILEVLSHVPPPLNQNQDCTQEEKDWKHTWLDFYFQVSFIDAGVFQSIALEKVLSCRSHSPMGC